MSDVQHHGNDAIRAGLDRDTNLLALVGHDKTIRAAVGRAGIDRDDLVRVGMGDECAKVEFGNPGEIRRRLERQLRGITLGPDELAFDYRPAAAQDRS